MKKLLSILTLVVMLTACGQKAPQTTCGMDYNGTIGEDVATRLCIITMLWEIGRESQGQDK